MAEIKCSCKDPNCKIAIGFNFDINCIALIGKNGETSAMHIDANTIVSMIKELKDKLNSIV